jgi:hypothetical protein
MGYIEIVEMDEYGVSVTDLSEVSDRVQQELWTALIKGEVK